MDILKTLKSPYIPVVYDYFVQGDTAYTVMEYIEGETLEDYLERGESYKQPQIIKWAIQILEALRYLTAPRTVILPAATFTATSNLPTS